ncbi:hypothetical protein ZIOFF_053397 [Zingiber officinale]|uniref:Uncharacterized protein n=1 Tax=Zingiber officinale TaxID=94328 RepID=A0A8J5FD36_ZINOF|nr:hypothetical protein ZIOFF_053397 [Zingiber officinale]
MMHDFQILRRTIQNDYREAFERWVFTGFILSSFLTKVFRFTISEFFFLDLAITGTRPTEEVIDHLIETGNTEQIFQKAIQEMGRGREFMDMAVLVETRGEILDNVESQEMADRPLRNNRNPNYANNNNNEDANPPLRVSLSQEDLIVITTIVATTLQGLATLSVNQNANSPPEAQPHGIKYHYESVRKNKGSTFDSNPNLEVSQN